MRETKAQTDETSLTQLDIRRYKLSNTTAALSLPNLRPQITCEHQAGRLTPLEAKRAFNAISGESPPSLALTVRTRKGAGPPHLMPSQHLLSVTRSRLVLRSSGFVPSRQLFIKFRRPFLIRMRKFDLDVGGGIGGARRVGGEGGGMKCGRRNRRRG